MAGGGVKLICGGLGCAIGGDIAAGACSISKEACGAGCGGMSRTLVRGVPRAPDRLWLASTGAAGRGAAWGENSIRAAGGAGGGAMGAP